MKSSSIQSAVEAFNTSIQSGTDIFDAVNELELTVDYRAKWGRCDASFALFGEPATEIFTIYLGENEDGDEFRIVCAEMRNGSIKATCFEV